MNDAIKDFLIKIMLAFPRSRIEYYVYGGFVIYLDEKNMLWFSLEKIESDIELKRRFISAVELLSVILNGNKNIYLLLMKH